MYAIQVKKININDGSVRLTHYHEAFRTFRGARKHLRNSGWYINTKNRWKFDAFRMTTDTRVLMLAYVVKIG